MARHSEWAVKVLALIKGGNTAAAIAQIKVAPDVKELKALQTELILGKLTGRWRDVDAAIADNISALAAPRLSRSP
ncbi:MAG: hypothetical protein RIS34_1947 [Pseudomonadota bacterium]|jgi:hypothetical protein